MWERFTERAKQVVSSARDQATFHGSEFVGTEHLLLALCLDPDDVAVYVLKALGVDLDAFVATLGHELPTGDAVDTDVSFTPAAKHVLECAVEESRKNSDSVIATQHLLLGLLRGSDGIATKVLTQFNVDYIRTKTEIDSKFKNEHDPGEAP